jgi:hypothetical protein
LAIEGMVVAVRLDGWTAGWLDGLMGRWLNGRFNGLTVDGSTARRLDGLMVDGSTA